MALTFASTDGRFRVRLGEVEARSLFGLCAAGWPMETGGVLVGYYAERRDTAVVTSVQGPPPDSRRGRTWFERGVTGLQTLFHRLWQQPRGSRRYYLGEWHLHPGAAATPSQIDRRQMQGIADGAYQCPEPVLMIVGGDPHSGWEIDVWVFRRQAAPVRLEALPASDLAVSNQERSRS